jgi:hypothetical protein
MWWIVAMTVVIPAIAIGASFIDRRWEEWENRRTDD